MNNGFLLLAKIGINVVLQCFVLRDEVDELDNRHSGFWHLLLWWLWTVKTPLKMLATDAKNTKNRTRSEFFYDGRKFRRQCANVIDITWGRIYFSTCENFGWKIRTQCAMALSIELCSSCPPSKEKWDKHETEVKEIIQIIFQDVCHQLKLEESIYL